MGAIRSFQGLQPQLGARVLHAMEPFTPEGGAYGHGRTMGHEHLGHEGGGHVPHVFTLSHAPLAPLHVQRHASSRPVEDEPEVADE